MLILKEIKLSSLLPLHTPKPNLILFFQLSTKPTKPHPFIVQYLITTIGFSSDKALQASTHLTHLQTPQKPDSVLHFLNKTGLTNTQIRTLLSWHPRLLCADVDKTLEPKRNAFENDGFSGLMLVQLIRSNPSIFQLRDALPRLRFWRSFFDHNEYNLLRAFRRNRNLINYDIDKRIIPNMSILQNYGLSNSDIVTVMTRVNGFIVRKPNSIKALIERTRELGFPSCDSGMFMQGLAVVAMLKGDTLERKIELFKSFGWSKGEIMSAFKKNPNFLTLSEENVRSTMDFLVGEAGCEVSAILRRPTLLAYSLERRLVPRHMVLRELKAKELGRKDWDFGSVVMLPEMKFLKRFVMCYQEEVPDLYKNYIDACAGRILV